MRFGCWGCLNGLLLAALLGAVIVGAGWALVRVTQAPEIPVVSASASDGLHAQQKLWGIGRRRPAIVILTERELNGFLAHHLTDVGETMDLTTSGAVITLGPGDSMAALVLVPVRELTTSAPLSAIASVLPAAWSEGRVWLSLRARPRIEEATVHPRRRYLRLVVEQVHLGRQQVPAMLLPLLLRPGTLRILRWRIPETIESVMVESGRVIIRTGPGR